ncbi:hypothetical protein [Algimonas arctica]|nr:hypothetical protein [Algimonas arctica]
MAKLALKTLTIIALTGTSLSGCAVIGGAADGAWSGTKYVARFVSTPVRALLRDAPKQDTQFAEVAVEGETVEHTDMVLDETITDDQDKIEMMAETIVEVTQTHVLGASTAPMPITPLSMTHTSTTDSWSSETTVQQPIKIVETVAISDFKSVDVVTVGSVSYVRTDGVGSLEDWQTCDVEAGGFWTFENAVIDGTLNPKFETCMKTKKYIQETQLDDAMIAELDGAESATVLKPLP